VSRLCVATRSFAKVDVDNMKAWIQKWPKGTKKDGFGMPKLMLPVETTVSSAGLCCSGRGRGRDGREGPARERAREGKKRRKGGDGGKKRALLPWRCFFPRPCMHVCVDVGVCFTVCVMCVCARMFVYVCVCACTFKRMYVYCLVSTQ